MNEIKTCPSCGVSIEKESIVRYSFGKPNNLEHLSKKVCQYNKKEGCINKLYDKDVKYESFI